MRTRLTALILALSSPAIAAVHPGAVGTRGMVATDNADVSAVGARVLAEGGDAVDAAVACALLLGVVQPFASGIGGGGFAVVHRADGSAYALDFREVAPGEATRDMFLGPDGIPVPQASTRGPRAAGVPGELAGLYMLHRRHGRLPWARVVAPALSAARDGFAASALLHERVSARRAEIATRPVLSRAFLTSDGQPVAVGARVVRPDLASTLALISAGGAEAFYRGAFAERLAAAIRADGGLITAADLAAYTPRERPPLVAEWRGHRVLTMPPPSSGGVVLLQVLGALEPDDLPSLGHNSSAYLHRLTEAFKHAFADRARVMGDPDHVEIPLDTLLGPSANARVRGAFRAHATLATAAYGAPTAAAADAGTSHLSVTDAAGNAVALTTTINTSFGSLYVPGNTGVLLNNEMDDFIVAPGVPNAFGLVGQASNAIAPGKRPLSSMTPTLVLRDGRPVLAVGGSGGPTIITGTVQVLLNALVFEMEAQAAVNAPRIHHQWIPESLFMEPEIPRDVRDALVRRGHGVVVAPRYNAVQVIIRRADRLEGASDPSKLGRAAAE